MIEIENINRSLSPLINQIKNHALYTHINSIEHLRIFMEHHVFAVYDFMCLLKELHRRLVSTQAPWFPPKDAYCARLINQILVDEEGDLSEDQSHYLSHFEIYLSAMEKIRANTKPIRQFLYYLNCGYDLALSSTLANLPHSAQEFVQTTFSFFKEETHSLAAAFVYGREAITPSLFIPLVQRLNQQFSPVEQTLIAPLQYYLQRHIELDQENHFPHALKILSNLARNDQDKWQGINLAAQRALMARYNLLTAIDLNCVDNHKNHSRYEMKD